MSDFTSYVRSLGKPNVVWTGRASTALLLLLRQLGVADRLVGVPANICYSVVHAILIAGARPRFFDLDPDDGNPRSGDVVAGDTPDLAAIVVPHMFGNPCREIGEIESWCRARGVVLIEDCAAGVAGEVDGRKLGSFGDHVLFSFGHGKPIDAGIGGAIASVDPLAEVERRNEEFPFRTPEVERRTELYSSLYRLILYSGSYDELLERFGAFNDAFDDIYCYRLRDDERRRAECCFAERDDRFATIRDVQRLYDTSLPFGVALGRYAFAKDAVPWRYNVLVERPSLRAAIIERLLADGVRVSTWYPPIQRLFGVRTDFPGARRFAERIVNVPLDQGMDTARIVVAAVRAARDACETAR